MFVPKSFGVSLSPRSDLRTQFLLKIPSCGGPPKTLFLKFCSCVLMSVYLLYLTQVHALKNIQSCLYNPWRTPLSPMIEFRTQTDIKACVLNEMASVYLLKRIINRRQLSCINFPPKINHYEASSAKHRITITLFLQGLNLLFTACYSTGLRWFLSSSMFDGNFSYPHCLDLLNLKNKNKFFKIFLITIK